MNSKGNPIVQYVAASRAILQGRLTRYERSAVHDTLVFVDDLEQLQGLQR